MSVGSTPFIEFDCEGWEGSALMPTGSDDEEDEIEVGIGGFVDMENTIMLS